MVALPHDSLLKLLFIGPPQLSARVCLGLDLGWAVFFSSDSSADICSLASSSYSLICSISAINSSMIACLRSFSKRIASKGSLSGRSKLSAIS